jgi:hypothetical protein|tara:strand:- start:246 stop:371 length:126 start_codon:yes stop_codon:yes gene_type:complete
LDQDGAFVRTLAVSNGKTAARQPVAPLRRKCHIEINYFWSI